MALTKYKLGELIKQRREKYDGIDDLPVRGVSREGFILPKQEGVDISIYNVYYKNDFVFNPARMELNSIALNSDFNKAICSSLYEIFYVSRTEILLPEYLNLYIKRTEFARKCWFEAIGSARNYFRVSNLSQFEIELPPISIQQKYVDVYNAMLENQKNYECGLDDLKLVCDAYIEELRRQNQCEPIGNYVHPYNVKNIEGKIILEQGINIEKKFITPHRTNDNFYGRKIVRKGHIAYCSQLNNENIAIALRTGPDCIVSNVYEVIEFNENCNLIPNYLMLWLVRSEFGRFVYWASQGTSYEFLTYENLANYRIPIPNVDIQKSITKIYEVYLKRKEINEKLKSQLKDICPILIKGSIEEGRRMKEA